MRRPSFVDGQSFEGGQSFEDGSGGYAAVAMTPAEDAEADLPRMTLVEHLEELRRRLFISIVAIFIGMIVSFFFYQELFDFVLAPYEQALESAGIGDRPIIETEPGESFFTVLKVCFIVGLVFTSPIVLWQMWGFIAAGLFPNERKYVRYFFPISLLLFTLGIVCAYEILIPFGFRFLVSWGANMEILTQYKISSYISTCITLVFGMGFVFQLPIVMVFLQAVEIVSRETFQKGWRWAVVFSFILGMMLTDPSPVTQILMAIPVVGLYFLGVWGGRFVGEDAEVFRWWKSWPVLIGLILFVLMILYADDLSDLFAAWFNPEVPKEASGESAG